MIGTNVSTTRRPVDRLTPEQYDRLNAAVEEDLPRTAVGEVALEIVNEYLSIDKKLVARAVARIEESKRSHQEWAEHIPTCAHCQEYGPPPYIQSVDEHLQIVAEYDEVLVVLRSLRKQGVK